MRGGWVFFILSTENLQRKVKCMVWRERVLTSAPTPLSLQVEFRRQGILNRKPSMDFGSDTGLFMEQQAIWNA